jgi:hypothetical protein
VRGTQILLKTNKGKRYIIHTTEEKKVEEDMLSGYVNLVKVLVCTLCYCTIMQIFYSWHAAPWVQHFVLKYVSEKGKIKEIFSLCIP